jgi:cytochrome b561
MDYSPLAKLLHWSVAALVVALIPMGLVMADLSPGPLQDRLFMLHESFGLVLLGLMAARVLSRLRETVEPAPLPPLERALARLVHIALYALLLLTPLVGWAALSAFGHGPDLFGVAELPTLLSTDKPLSKTLFSIHEAAGLAIGALALLHVAGALRHGRAEGSVIWRMAPRGRR